MAKLQPNFHLFAPDRPGCGLTQMFNYNNTGKPFRQHAVDFIESTMDALGVKTATLIGNPWAVSSASPSLWRTRSVSPG
jgi:pimeloyl-ACP methyl ester carboxylesterase